MGAGRSRERGERPGVRRPGSPGANGNDERTVVVLYAFAAAFMSCTWLAAFSYLSHHPGLLEPGTTAEYARKQVARPITGIALYVISGLAGWFINPVAGLVSIILMIIYHAVTSEGLQGGPLGRLIRRKEQN